MDEELVDSTTHPFLRGDDGNFRRHFSSGGERNRTSTAANGAMDEDACRGYAKFDYQIPLIIICVICFITGIIYCFFGYRFFKAVLFLTGFLFGSVSIYLICDREELLPTLGNAGVAVGAGVLFGLVTMLVQYVGLFMSGFLTGLFAGLVVLMLWSSLASPGTIWATVGVLFGVGLIFALASLKWQRIMIIINTALVGAALLSTALDYFADRFAVIERQWEAVNVKRPRWHVVCWYGWLILAVWPCLFVLGIFVQWRWTSVGFDHKDGCRHFRRRRPTPSNGGGNNRRATNCEHGRNGAERARAASYVYSGGGSGGNVSPNAPYVTGGGNGKMYESKPWRSVYQSRRTHGDVICQSYLESLQRLSQNPRCSPRQGSSVTQTPTLISDHTRLTVLTNESHKSGQSDSTNSDKLNS